NPGTDRTASEFSAKGARNPWQSGQSLTVAWQCPAILKEPFESPAPTWPRSKSAEASRTIERHDDDMKNIFVGNLDFAATESSIRSLFEPYGQVDRVNLVTDRDTGRSRGFAFVEMTDSAEADRAIAALNGTDLDGRALNINEARPK